ncbi:MAG TPA: molybdenum cofactor biosynthesis protein MoaE [Terriglobales bacterium]|nr:molybdenum cofactor biosynthesis protein MoaE [Terriglobales bacterium]
MSSSSLIALLRLFRLLSRILRQAMHVRVLLFGVLKDIFRRSEDSLELSSGDTVSDVLEHYRELAPDRASLFHSVALAVNQEYAAPDRRLQDGDEVALLPPVSGGLETPVRPGSYKCEIVRESIPTEQILQGTKHAEDGAVVVFEGIVRNRTRNRQTLFLDYEAYEPMALSQLNALAEKVLANYKIREIVIVHRLGRLEIGETSVLIVVASDHRAAAFDACRFAIDTLKRTVPIWKKEHFSNGVVWADGEPFPEELRVDRESPKGRV